jgi:hypothetical protein
MQHIKHAMKSVGKVPSRLLRVYSVTNEHLSHLHSQGVVTGALLFLTHFVQYLIANKCQAVVIG